MNRALQRIPSHLAQKILEILADCLRKDIHILDNTSCIMASTQPQRIGKKDPQALPLLKGEVSEYAVSQEEENSLLGMEAGYSLPISFEGDIIGAIRISGDPQLVKPFVELAVRFACLTIWNYSLEKKHQAVTENLLAESEDKYRQLVERATDGIMIIQDFRILYVNNRLAEIMGYQVQEVLGTVFMDYLHPQKKEEVLQRYRDRMAGKEITNLYETILLHRDGHSVIVEINAGLIPYLGETANLVFVRDISQRKEVEDKLRQSERLFMDILNFLPDATFAINQEKEVIFWNKAAEHLTGVKAQEMLGQKDQAYSIPLYGEKRPILIDLIEEDIEELQKNYAHLERSGEKTLMGENFCPGIGEKGAYLWGKATPLYDYYGNPVGAIESFRDITTFKEAQRVLIKSNEKLLELDRLRNEFICNISHELRTPLTAMMGFAHIIQKRLDQILGPSQDTREKKNLPLLNKIDANLKILQREGERLMNIVDNIITIADLDSRKEEGEKKLLSINQILEEAIQEKTPLAQEKGIQIQVQLETDLPMFWGEKERIHWVIQEILSNAIKFSFQGTIFCQTRQEEGRLHLQVTDTGIGIQKEDQEFIFAPFRQVQDQERGKPHGTGLGLFICQKIIQKEQGRLWVESRPGEGSTFSFTLPLLQGEERAPSIS